MKILEERALSRPTFHLLRLTFHGFLERCENAAGGLFSILPDDSALADVVGDVAGSIGEANDRFCADIGNHTAKSFSALLVE